MIYNTHTNSFSDTLEEEAPIPTLGEEMSEEDQASRIAKIADEIEWAFTWTETEIGSNYWMDVVQNLMEVSTVIRNSEGRRG